ncbi:RNA polymerase II transcriptional coactivator KELP [Mangifera indica]|uniref:RNA polymerase II transcriptional coactivator KELP n=1 Tax=Mangifera indica TaxID=29780 RepID=UPI001CFBD886|nr:RNA polymerase II transcriptional coactivator KELP [Mangifera indica]
MEAEMKKKIEETVRKILEHSDMSETTEYQIRKQASEKMGLDLSQSQYKAFVRTVVNSFLEEQEEKSKQEQEQEVEQEEQEAKNVDEEYDDEGNLIICKLSDKRRVTIQDFRGKTLVSIREYYKKDDKELPSAKGIALTEEQWSALKNNVPAIEEAIRMMESRIM